MIEVMPAVMPENVADIRQHVKQVLGHVQTVQLDIMDGVFVPEKTWPYTDAGMSEFDAIREEKEGFPHWDDINYEVDLMVANSGEVLQDWIAAGVQRVIVHVESADDIEEIVRTVQAWSVGDEKLNLQVEFGLALNPDTDNSALDPYMDSIDFVQFMGIDRIGYQGQEFNNDVLVKISSLRKQYPNAIISIDGGVSLETAPKLVKAGVNRLVSGSAIFESGDVAAVIQEFQGLNESS